MSPDCELEIGNTVSIKYPVRPFKNERRKNKGFQHPMALPVGSGPKPDDSARPIPKHKMS